MARKDLKNKPLVEAILEIKWNLARSAESPSPPSMLAEAIRITDSCSATFDRVMQEYPVHEPLPAATLPDEIVGHVVQHRFRAGKGDWPLVQVGPGIFSVNDTHRYTWTDFQRRTKEAVGRLFDAHPNASELRIQSLCCDTSNGVEYDYQANSASPFCRTN